MLTYKEAVILGLTAFENEERFHMRINNVDHEATKVNANSVRIRFVQNDEHGVVGKMLVSVYSRDDVELLITYLKGVRDGMGWNERHNK